MDRENLAADLKQLVLGFESHVREAGSLEQVEDALHHLEENEQHFHKYEFVKQLKCSIEENLGMFIDEEIEKCNMGGQTGVSPGHGSGLTGGQGGVTIQEPLVNHITEKVIQSSPMNELMVKLKRSVATASDSLLKNFDREFSAVIQRQSPTHGKLQHENHFPEDDDTSYVSSLNQPGSLMFMNTDRFVRLTEDLAKTRSFETRQEALHQLNLLPGVEIVCCEQWPNVRKGILDTLADSDHSLSTAALKFIMQAFSTTAPRTVDIYSLLVEHLVLQFTSRKSVIPSLKMGLDVRKPELSRIVKAFRLMNEFQREAPFYWVRYPEKYMREVLESSLDLLCLSPSQSVCPMHIVALLDPTATWFIRWMHGSYSRAPFLQLLVRYRPLLESAVKHCLQFCQRRKTVNDWSRQKYMHSAKQPSVRLTLTGPELEYAYFLHSVHLLITLVSFSGGRSLFPVKMIQREEPVHISELLLALVSLIDDPGMSCDSSNTDDIWSPASVATKAIKFLCCSSEVYAACLCDDRLTNAIVQPLRDCLSSVSVPSEATLLRVADILSVIAMSSRGRRQLLYGQNGTLFSKHRSTATSVVAEFTVSALESCVSPGRADSVSKPLTGELLYVCRQLYSTCEGLTVLSPYSLHTCVANALQEACDACDKAATPTPRGDQDWGPDRIPGLQHDELIWEETLRGHLLSFTATAKGILLLQQTGALNECVSYLTDRFTKKVQVGKCEKFGYGYMVTQVATTSPGMVALHKSGLLESVLTELWSVLECGATSIPVVTPRAWPVDPIDPPALKPLIRLLNMLSSFPAVYEAVADQVVAPQETYSLRQGPQSVASLIDRLVIMNTPAKIHSLFNYEQSHVCGLRLLSVLTSSLDTLLLLQSQYHFQESLLSCQGENTPQNRLYPSESRLSKERSEVIIDMVSVERNYVLVKTYLVGGEGERLLPQRSLLQSSPELYPFPLFSAYPVPREYSTNLSARAAMKQATSKLQSSQDNELSRLLAEGKKKPDRSSEGWLDKCRAAMCSVLSTKPEITKGNTVQYLLEQGVIVLAAGPEAVFPLTDFSGNEKAVRSYKLSPLQQLGVSMAVRYGSQLKLLSSQSEGSSGLTQLLKLSGSLLQQHRSNIPASPRYMSSQSYPGFDWFVATIYLIFNGSLDRSWKFLQKFSTLSSSGYLWPARLHSSVHLSPALSCGVPPVFYRTGHNVELVLQTEFPLITAAFKMSGYTPAQICCHWLRQCFWNYLDWLDVCHYVSVITLLGPDYQVYACVSILRHLQDNIRRHMHSHDLVIFLKEEPIRGFRLGHHLTFMKTLEEKFRKMILQDMLNFSTP